MTNTMAGNIAKLPLIARLRDRLDEHRRRLDDHNGRIDQHEVRLNRQLARLDALQTKLDDWSVSLARARVEYTAGAHQLNAFEQRLAELEAKGVAVAAGDEADTAEARALVDVVRSEHARVRARLTLFTTFDERLRRVESGLLHAIKVGHLPTPPKETVGADVIEARRSGVIAPDANELPKKEHESTATHGQETSS